MFIGEGEVIRLGDGIICFLNMKESLWKLDRVYPIISEVQNEPSPPIHNDL